MALKEIRSRVLELVRAELAGLAFTKRAGDIFTRDLTSEVLGWIGLNRATRGRPGVLEINPVVGVRHQPIERLLAELRGEKAHPYVPPTLSVHLGYLMPERAYRPWLFPEGEDPEAEAMRMVQAIGEFGVPFMRENAALEPLVATLETSAFGIAEQRHYRLPVMYFLLDRKARAEEYIAERLGELRARDDLAARHYRSFAEALRQRMNR